MKIKVLLNDDIDKKHECERPFLHFLKGKGAIIAFKFAELKS